MGAELPGAFTALQAHHFPLFLTMTRLLELLDAVLPVHFFTGRSELDKVGFAEFAASFWPRMAEALRHRLQPLVVYGEIVTFIKGGSAAVRTPGTGRLSRERYCALAQGRRSTLNEEERGHVYTMFERYEQLKAERGQWDQCDAVSHVYQYLEQMPARGREALAKLARVYVDEVQDLTEAEITLLRFLCPDVDRGFVLAGKIALQPSITRLGSVECWLLICERLPFLHPAGDTAQTIARGVGFRFERVRELFFTDFLGADKSKGMPPLFTLTANYRTHDGVLRVGNLLVKMLLQYFPHEVDKLPEETGQLHGPRPLFVNEVTVAELAVVLFGGDPASMTAETPSELGAAQVILVREDSDRDVLLQGGPLATSQILTILESKGLEFDDVIIYNFFDRSIMTSADWRVVYGFFQHLELPAEDREAEPFPRFEEGRHRLLCSELKALYVAVTRARRQLIFYDGSLPTRKPLRELLLRMRAVRAVASADYKGCGIAQYSTPEEWHAEGRKYFASEMVSCT